MRHSALAPLSLLLLCSCAHTLPAVNAIDATRVGDVTSELKRQLSVYQSQVNIERATVKPTKHTCGNGLIDFDITSVQLNLTTTTEDKSSGNVSATIPVYAGTVTPSGSFSHDVSDTQTLVLPLYPVHDLKFKVDPADTVKKSPIADALTAVRQGLLQNVDQKRVCVFDFDYTAKDPSQDAGGSYTLGITVVDDGAAGVTLKLAVLSLGASYERKVTSGNSLTVKFKQIGLPKAPVQLDANNVPTDYPGGGEAGQPILHPKP